jgi:uncharacterized membrane protein
VSAAATVGGLAKSGGRVDAVDVARGLALVLMVAYHLTWDLAYFRLVSPHLPFTMPMRLLSHAIACAFLALVGVSLALAHRDGLNRAAFNRRLLLVAGAAALVTGGTAIVFLGALTVWFGILHCIVAASLLALPLIEAPAAVGIAAGAALVALPFFVQSTAFDSPALLWLGLGQALPNTVDWYPLTPWAGVTLLGLGVTRAPGVMPWLTRPRRWRARSAFAAAIGVGGRHSLAIYLLHQPVLGGLVWAVAASGILAPAPPQGDRHAFLGDCRLACVAGGRSADDGGASCNCVDAVERSSETMPIGRTSPEGKLSPDLKRAAEACRQRLVRSSLLFVKFPLTTTVTT